MKFNRNASVFIAMMAIIALASCSTFGDSNFNSQEEEGSEIVPETISSVISYEEPGQLIDAFFYDIKQVDKDITSLATANELFSADDMNGIRMPILGNLKAPAHPSSGVVVAAEYESYVNSINFAKQVRGGRDFKVFASKKLNDGDGVNSFPDWVKDNTGVIPEKYALLLADFLEYMETENIQIDYLGIDNEFIFNEGQMSPAKYSETIDALRILAVDRGFTMPILVGYEDFGPNKRNWVKTLMENNWGDKMDIYGTHYYPQFRPMANLLVDLSYIGDRPFWATEPHWDAKSEVDDYDEAEAAIVTLWEQIDVGMSGLMWWSYQLTGVRGNLMRTFSTPLLGAQEISITDIDGEDITELGKLQTRAFKEDKTITVFLVNMSATSYDDYAFEVGNSTIAGKITTKQFTASAEDTGEIFSTDAVGGSQNIFSINLPSRSFTRITFNIE